tara:strand:+ start:219 stop:524 length:306 start_codon:yes stop_codon:yes gene_type:complete
LFLASCQLNSSLVNKLEGFRFEPVESMTTFDISFADMTSPEIVTMFEQPQVTDLPELDSTSFPQERHLTLIDSITLILFVYTQNNYRLLYKKMLYEYLILQ